MSKHASTGTLQEALARVRWLLPRDSGQALAQIDAVLAIYPDQPDASWLKVRALEASGRTADAIIAAQRATKASLRISELQAAATALTRGESAVAERYVRPYLGRSPDDVLAMLILADVATRVGIYPEAERLLRQAGQLAPSYPDISVNLAMVLFQQARISDSLSLLDRAIELAPDHPRALASKADILAQTGDYDAAVQSYRLLLDRQPEVAEIWIWYGNVLKTIGRRGEAVRAYRRATEIDPGFAEAWWSLTELKDSELGDGDISVISHELVTTRDPLKQVFFHFALGRGFEIREDWKQAFDHYAEGNRHRLALEPHDSAAISAEVDSSIALFDRRFFAARAGSGSPCADPIFIVGMPRAGSTLIEQILASHSLIEGTSELPDIPLLVRSTVASNWTDRTASYPGSLVQLDGPAITNLAERYLHAASAHRKTSAHFFIDKLPNNWRYIGFIHLILPNAKIIDARRDAMACCFSNFKQHFTRGQTFAYSQADLARYYRDYVRMVAHFDREMPGLVHRVQHEALLADTEREVRSLLNFVGVPFEEQCLRPHENRRPVRTASSEQVRKPISTDALDHWRHFEAWLTELRVELGDVWNDAQSR
ncbi:MAG TPA: sulfotransferase [Sphingomonas sp.]|nr:sulfotransferase [Sphingomonas sp.]